MSTTTDLPRLLRLADASEQTGIPVRTLRNEFRAGRLKGYRAPSSTAPILLRASDVLDWLDTHCAARTRVPAPGAGS